MKKGYKKLLIFETVILFLFIINSFFLNILDNYQKVFFLILLITIFKKIFGIEKDNHRYIKDVIFEMFIFLFIFFILYYLSGIFISFIKINNYYTFKGITNVIIPIILIIILKEYLRYSMILKSEGNNLLIIVTCILFIFLDITNTIYYNDFKTKYDYFIFIALTLFPTISTNLVCSYISYKVGYKPNIVYLLIINLYQYLLPIIPNPNQYLSSIIQILLPISLIYRLNKFFKLSHDEYIERNYRKKHIVSLFVPTIFIIILIYFTSGYFKYYSIAIASGSMEKKLSKGDIVIVEKINKNYQELKTGNIIAYKYNEVIVVHRIVKIIKEKEKIYIYTKGDANKNIDNYFVEEEQVIGTVKFKIPYIGLPTVWLNEL